MTEISPQQAAQIAEDFYGLRGEITPLDSEWGGTFRLKSETGNYLIKIAPNHVDQGRTAMEVAALKHLGTKDWQHSYPKLIRSNTGEASIEMPFGVARIHEWIEGRLWSDVNPHSEHLYENLGERLGSLKTALTDFDHSAGNELFDWSPHEVAWIASHLSLLDDDLRVILEEVVSEIQGHEDHIKALPQSLNYNDGNDNNILVSSNLRSPDVVGFIDFGDMSHGPAINDLAIAIAYTVAGQNDPIGAACAIVRGYVKQYHLKEAEIEVLLSLAKARLAISLVKAAQRGQEDPDNAYWQINVAGSRKLIEQLHSYRPHLALCRLRHAAGYEPSPTAERVRNWIKSNFNNIYPVTGIDLTAEQVEVFDWSVENIEMGGFDDIADVDEGTRKTFAIMAAKDVRVGIGRYNEPRAVYTTDEYAIVCNNGPEMRTIHTGIDIFMEAGTPLYAPLDGVVQVLHDDAGDKEYGPLVVLRHEVEEDLEFFTLYGHNSLQTLDLLKPGQKVKKGELIAYIGDYPENGNWVPHSHFQIMTHMLGYDNDFPGVALASQREVWLSICPDANLMLGIQDPRMQCKSTSVADLLNHRRRALGPNLSVSHKTPLHIVRGWKTFLYNTDGTKYLDTRNNIAHVGHEHPNVVKAGQKQMAVLNTNTRYLHKKRLELADKLLATLPDHLTRIYLVNAGSEANDLALRMAYNYTKSNQTLVMDNGYHGHTKLCLDASHYKFDSPGGYGRQDHIHVLPAIGIQLSSDTHSAIKAFEDMNTHGEAMTFIHEALPSCAGQVVPPKDYFSKLYAEVHKSGGCCIADEVQTGIGRVGEKFWSFQLFDARPDIVTIGKPLGNGHPVAAVAVSEEIAQAFDTGMEFFSSFGGNPVSCAVGSAVLDTIDTENLQKHALDMGEYWKGALFELQESHSVIRDVRGFGLFLGVEFQNALGTPATEKCKYIESRMFDHKILTSFDGPFENVMKIKPPMCITRSEIDYFMEVLEKILKEDVVTAM